MNMDPRGFGFRPGDYEYRRQSEQPRPTADEISPNTYRIPFFGSWQSVILKAVAVSVVLAVIILALSAGLVPR